MNGFPEQYKPAPDGLGDVHDLVRCFCPTPQVTLQLPYDLQLDQPPFTPVYYLVLSDIAASLSNNQAKIHITDSYHSR